MKNKNRKKKERADRQESEREAWKEEEDPIGFGANFDQPEEEREHSPGEPCPDLNPQGPLRANPREGLLEGSDLGPGTPVPPRFPEEGAEAMEKVEAGKAALGPIPQGSLRANPREDLLKGRAPGWN